MANVLSKVTSSITFLLGLFLVCTTVVFYLLAGEAIKAAAPWLIWSVVGGIIIYILIRLYFLIDASRLENKAIRAETANTIVQNKLASEESAWRLRQNQLLTEGALALIRAGLVHPESLGTTPTIRQFGTSNAKQAEKMLPDQVATGNLLNEIASLDNLLIVGGKGSGKTSLMQHLESAKQKIGRTIILDSHAQPAQWQGDVVGMGRRYGKIKNAMIGLLESMDKRYKKWEIGQTEFEPVTQIIDEFTLLPPMLKKVDYDIQDYSKQMLTEGRKVEFHCVWGIHSDRAEALGLKGAMDLLECFDAIIHLKHNQKTDEYYGFIDYGEGQLETRYAHPGPFVVQPKQAALQSQLTQVATALQPQQTILDLPVASKSEQPIAEQQIMIHHKRGLSATAICEKVYGYKNTLKVKHVKSVIEAATGASEK